VNIREDALARIAELADADPDEADRGLRAALEYMQAETLFGYSEPKQLTLIVAVAARIIAAVRSLPTQSAVSQPKLEIQRHGDTNVVALWLPYIWSEVHRCRLRVSQNASPTAYVLSKHALADRIRQERRRQWWRVTRAPIANDMATDDVDDVVFSRPASVRMAMKGRLARIMAESRKGEQIARAARGGIGDG
jgi:hypothetical protein